MQLVLKALVTIGDLPNQVEAAMIVGICAEMEDGSEASANDETNQVSVQESVSKETSDGRRVVRRSSASQ